MKRHATSVWKGSGKEGKGTLTTQSGALDEQPYSFRMRFENEDGKLGTNPDELIAAAHAGCFNMALAVQLSNEGYTPDRLETRANLLLEKQNGGFAITTINLKLEAKVPNITLEKFNELAGKAKEGCPVSKVLNARITLESKLLD